MLNFITVATFAIGFIRVHVTLYMYLFVCIHMYKCEHVKMECFVNVDAKSNLKCILMKILKSGSGEQRCRPLIDSAFVATITSSNTSRNRSGERTQPQRSPRQIEQASEICPLSRTSFSALGNMFLIMFVMVSETLLRSRYSVIVSMWIICSFTCSIIIMDVDMYIVNT